MGFFIVVHLLFFWVISIGAQGEVHHIRDMPGHSAWRKFLDLIGFSHLGMEELQVLLRQGYERAKEQGYKQGGRRDHA